MTDLREAFYSLFVTIVVGATTLFLIAYVWSIIWAVMDLIGGKYSKKKSFILDMLVPCKRILTPAIEKFKELK